MKCFVGFFLFLLPNVSSRIFGHRFIPVTDAPYIVRIHNKATNSLCCGSILSKEYIVTAAHCIPKAFDKVTIKAGSSLSNLNSRDGYKIAEVFFHSDWNPKNMNSDIALVKLSKKLIFSKLIQAIELPQWGGNVTEGVIGNVSGWGQDNSLSHFVSNDLIQSKMRVLSEPQCENALRFSRRNITSKSVFCAIGEKYLENTCRVNSGGPFVTDGKFLQGITSFGYACGEWKFPVIFTNVNYFRDFIATKVNCSLF